MGILKKVLEESIRSKHEDNEVSQISKNFVELKDYFAEHKGKIFLWYNSGEKKYILVKVLQPYDRYVVVEQSLLNLDKEMVKVNRSVSYPLLYSDLDKMYCLEGDDEWEKIFRL